mmetsp:Transcript_11543/g.28257  ORF Transcript_11543/g.28257 Transcript_11543/m.28257 type:complete len:275 (+) Transcript_11543:2368-3192(+)
MVVVRWCGGASLLLLGRSCRRLLPRDGRGARRCHCLRWCLLISGWCSCCSALLLLAGSLLLVLDHVRDVHVQCATLVGWPPAPSCPCGCCAHHRLLTRRARCCRRLLRGKALGRGGCTTASCCRTCHGHACGRSGTPRRQLAQVGKHAAQEGLQLWRQRCCPWPHSCLHAAWAHHSAQGQGHHGPAIRQHAQLAGHAWRQHVSHAPHCHGCSHARVKRLSGPALLVKLLAARDCRDVTCGRIPPTAPCAVPIAHASMPASFRLVTCILWCIAVG